MALREQAGSKDVLPAGLIERLKVRFNDGLRLLHNLLVRMVIEESATFEEVISLGQRRNQMNIVRMSLGARLAATGIGISVPKCKQLQDQHIGR